MSNPNMPWMPVPMNPSTPSEDNSNKMTTMDMSFQWGKDAVVLFSGWPGDSIGMYLLAICFVIFLAAAVEVLAAFPTPKRATNPIVSSFSQATVYAVRKGLAYLIMLSVMSFNGGVLISAVFGHFIGFFLVKARASKVEAEGVPVPPKV